MATVHLDQPGRGVPPEGAHQRGLRAGYANFAKFAFYWGGAKYSGYVPGKGYAGVYDWDRNGAIDHVAIVTSHYDTSTYGKHYVVGGNQYDGVNHPQYANWASSIVGYTSPARK